MDVLPVVCKQGVRGSSPLSSTRQNTPTKIAGRGARAISVPLPGRDQHAAQAITVVIRPVPVAPTPGASRAALCLEGTLARARRTRRGLLH